MHPSNRNRHAELPRGRARRGLPRARATAVDLLLALTDAEGREGEEQPAADEYQSREAPLLGPREHLIERQLIIINSSQSYESLVVYIFSFFKAG